MFVMEFDPDELGMQVDHLESELDLEYYMNFSGRKEEFDTTSIYDRYSHLFSDRTLPGQLSGALSEATDEGFEKVLRLFRFTATTYISYHTRELADNITTRESSETLLFQGSSVPFRNSAVLLANESDPKARRELEDARLDFIRRLNLEYVALLKESHELSRGLGYKNYAAMFEELKGFDFNGLATEMSAFLEATETTYNRIFSEYVENLLGMPANEVARCDLPHLFRASSFDDCFPADGAFGALNDTLERLGLELKKQKNIIVDDEPRPSKSPRAFCACVRIPDEIYLVISPQGGLDDYRSLLHEAGHAEHFGHTRPDLSPIYQRLGDAATSECYAFLFDNLVMNRSWLENVAGLEPARAGDVVRFSAFHKLYMLRRFAAKFVYELELHRGVEHPEDVYSRLLSRATGVPWPAEYYLSDTDEGFYCADYIRAWIAEVQVRQSLVDTYGPDWYACLPAGRELKKNWSDGSLPDIEDVLRAFGQPGLDLGPLVEELRAALE